MTLSDESEYEYESEYHLRVPVTVYEIYLGGENQVGAIAASTL